MSVIFAVLKEELERLESLKISYSKKVSVLPKGSISIKRRGNSDFAYLAWRENKKVKFQYLGKRDSEQVISIQSEITERKELECKLRQINLDIKRIKKALHGNK